MVRDYHEKRCNMKITFEQFDELNENIPQTSAKGNAKTYYNAFAEEVAKDADSLHFQSIRVSELTINSDEDLTKRQNAAMLNIKRYLHKPVEYVKPGVVRFEKKDGKEVAQYVPAKDMVTIFYDPRRAA